MVQNGSEEEKATAGAFLRYESIGLFPQRSLYRTDADRRK